MSYILDALKRADAERERGHVPGLHSRSAPTLDRPTSGRPQRWWPAVIGGGALLLLGLVAWWGWLRAAPEAPTPVAAVDTGAVPAPAVAPAEPAAGTPPTASTDSTLPTLPILAPEPPRPPRPAPAQAAAPASPAARSASANTSPPAAAASTPAAAAASPVKSFADLSAAERAGLPAVAVSGSTYSQDPALRMLIANGKVVQEGGDIAPGLRLETIEPRSAVLNHRGLRYRIGY